MNGIRDMSSESEAKILYLEGDKLRVFRGYVIAEDNHFIHLKRRDGEIWLGKRHIIKVEQREDEPE